MRKSWNGMNILQYIEYCMDQGMTEENAEICADSEFGLNDSTDN